MKIGRDNIESVIPQREPFIMIENLLSSSPSKFESNFHILPGNIFLENNILRETALIENIAQTCAAGFGSLKNLTDGKPGLGFIGGISKVKVHKLPRINDLIFTKVDVLHQFENIFLVRGETSCENEKLLECEMKIVVN